MIGLFVSRWHIWAAWLKITRAKFVARLYATHKSFLLSNQTCRLLQKCWQRKRSAVQEESVVQIISLHQANGATKLLCTRAPPPHHIPSGRRGLIYGITWGWWILRSEVHYSLAREAPVSICFVIQHEKLINNKLINNKLQFQLAQVALKWRVT